MISSIRRRSSRHENLQDLETANTPLGITIPLLATAALLVLLSSGVHWVRKWLISGGAVESLLLIYGASFGRRIFPEAPLWTLLSTLNVAYAVCSTSWLLYIFFTLTVYPCILLTSLFQFNWVAGSARKCLRVVLKQLYFTRDKIAFFNLPALEIDTDVDGLFLLRGLTIQLSSLKIVIHGIELGLKLANDIELAIQVDEMSIWLFRRIEVGEVLINVKGRTEMSFSDAIDETDDTDDDSSIFLGDTPLLRAATTDSKNFQSRPRLRENLTASYTKTSTAKDGLDAVETLSPDDEDAERHYQRILDEIQTSSTAYQNRAKVLKSARDGNGIQIDSEENLRAAVCAAMHDDPSVAHAPTRSIKVTTIQNLLGPAIRRFLHRLPFLLRLLLMLLSFFHAISFSSVSAAGSGKWAKTLLKQHVFKDYAAQSTEIRRLQRKLLTWLADANFCIQFADISAQSQVPMRPVYDIMAYLKFSDIIVYRTALHSGDIAQVARLGGADATITVPSFLLPHHEHILPPRPTPQKEHEFAEEISTEDSKPKAIQAEDTLARVRKDETTVTVSVHCSLPACFDQLLLDFVAALVKATKVIEFEKEIEEHDADRSRAPTPSNSIDSSTDSPTTNGSLKLLMSRTIHSLSDGSTKESIREKARILNQSTKDGIKRAAIGGMVSDRWIAKMVGKVATKLEEARGNAGYSADIPVPLEPYRPAPGLPSKLLP